MAERVTRATLGAWVLKANPNIIWDVHGDRDRGGHVASWHLHASYRVALIEVGDPVLLWVTRDHARGRPAGFYGSGAVTQLPRADDVDVDDPDEVGRWELGVAVDYLDEPVTKDELLARGLGTIEVIRAPRVGNPSYLTSEEATVVREFIRE